MVAAAGTDRLLLRRLRPVFLRHIGEFLDLTNIQSQSLGNACSILRISLVEQRGLTFLNAFLRAR